MDNSLVVIENNQLAPAFSAQYIEIKRAADKLNAQLEELKAEMLKAMEEKGILELSNEELKIRYVAPTEAERFDSKAFRADHEDIYNDYVKFVPVKSQLRITKK